MLDFCSLQSLFSKQIEETHSDFEKSVFEFLSQGTQPACDFVDKCQWNETLLSEERTIENWKLLLSFSIFCDLINSFSQEIGIKIYQFEKHPWNQSSQYTRALVALNHALAKMPIPEVGSHLLESGAALIDLHEYCPWFSLPYTPQHFEFGIYLCLLSLITKRADLHETVLRLAQWQLNTLSNEGKPLAGLFVREQETKSLHHLCTSYLLFKSAAALKKETPFAAIAKTTLHHIQNYILNSNEKIDPLWVLIEKWLDQYKVLSNESFYLQEQIYDPSTALVGFRSPAQHLVCTLHGMQTGLGEFRHYDIEIVNYGPQYLPLGECQGFGIEGNSLSDQGVRRSMIEWRRGHAFILKGCTRMVDQPVHSSSEKGKFRGIWLDVAQEFKNPHFYLKTTFLGLDGWDSIAFSFFVKAAGCKVQSQHLRPHMLDKYNGEAKPILLEGKEHVLELRPLTFKGTMEVIPLAGGNHFWGADFLVAFLISPDQRHYQWHIGPPI